MISRRKKLYETMVLYVLWVLHLNYENTTNVSSRDCVWPAATPDLFLGIAGVSPVEISAPRPRRGRKIIVPKELVGNAVSVPVWTDWHRVRCVETAVEKRVGKNTGTSVEKCYGSMVVDASVAGTRIPSIFSWTTSIATGAWSVDSCRLTPGVASTINTSSN